MTTANIEITFEEFKSEYLKTRYALAGLQSWFDRARKLGITDVHLAKSLALICYEDHCDDLKEAWDDIYPPLDAEL